jgi:hypothetical protein
MGERVILENRGEKMVTASTFEYQVHFIGKTRSETYPNTLKRESKPKNVHDAKNRLQLQTCSGVESCGVQL